MSVYSLNIHLLEKLFWQVMYAVKNAKVTSIAHGGVGDIIKYLDQCSTNLHNLECMQWVSLKQVPTWSDVEKTMDFAAEKQMFDIRFDSSLFDEFTCAASTSLTK